MNEDLQRAELPQYWQDEIAKLRAENFGLRMRLKAKTVDPDELPPSWLAKYRKTQRESVKYRHERNELRAELEALRAELGK